MSNMEAFNKIMSEIGEQLNEETINTIKAALEAKDKPVAWMNGWGDLFKNPDDAEGGQTMQPLYTIPTQRKPLTVEEIAKLDCYDHLKFARAIEAAHGIK